MLSFKNRRTKITNKSTDNRNGENRRTKLYIIIMIFSLWIKQRKYSVIVKYQIQLVILSLIIKGWNSGICELAIPPCMLKEKIFASTEVDKYHYNDRQSADNRKKEMHVILNYWIQLEVNINTFQERERILGYVNLKFHLVCLKNQYLPPPQLTNIIIMISSTVYRKKK